MNEFKNNTTNHQAYSSNIHSINNPNILPFNSNMAGYGSQLLNQQNTNTNNTNNNLMSQTYKMNPNIDTNNTNNNTNLINNPIGSNIIMDEMIDSDEGEQQSNRSSQERKSGRRKIKIEYIQDKSRRHITFSKRKAGIMKKAYELSTLTGTQILLLVVSETGLVYTFTTPKLQPLVTQNEGKNLIQSCLNAPDNTNNNTNNLESNTQHQLNNHTSPYINNNNNNNSIGSQFGNNNTYNNSNSNNNNNNNPSNYGSPQLSNLNNQNNPDSNSFANYWTQNLAHNQQIDKHSHNHNMNPNNANNMYALMDHTHNHND